MTCPLLKRSRESSERLYGLKVDEKGEWAVDPNACSQCGATGGFKISGRLAFCSLNRRLKSLRQLDHGLRQRWQIHLSDLPERKEDTPVSKLRAAYEADTSQAQILYGEPRKPGSIWHIAAEIIWRDWGGVHLVHLGEVQENRLLPKVELPSPLHILIEQIDNKNAIKLEALISYAYQSNALLWMEKLPKEQASEAALPSYSLDQQVRQKTALGENKDPLQSLSAQSRSKLETLTTFPRTLTERGEPWC